MYIGAIPWNPAIPFLDIYPEKTLIRRDTCTPIFIVAPFTIAKTQKQAKYPPTDECIKKTRYKGMSYDSSNSKAGPVLYSTFPS